MELDSRKKSSIITIFVIFCFLLCWIITEIVTQRIAMKDGIQYLKEKKYEKALEKFQKAEKKHALFSSKKTIRYYEGDCLITLGRYEDAAKVFDKITSKEPEARAFVMKGFAYQLENKRKDAEDSYKQAIHIEPDNGIGYYYLYAYYVENGKYKDALKVLKSTDNVSLKSMQQEVEFAKVIVCEKLLQYKKALKEVRKYCEKYPKDKKGIREKTFLETR